MNVVIVVLLVSLVSAVVVSNRVTFIVTSTALVTTTSTSTKSTSTACVIYSNAPSACPSRRKRQVWLKPPIIAEDEVDKNQLIQPQPVQWVQPTADHTDHYKIPYSSHAQPYFYPVDAQWTLQPSVAEPGYFGHIYSYVRVPDQAQPSFRKSDPIKVPQIYNQGRLFNIVTLVTQTATATVTNTATAIVTTKTNTLYVSGCKPAVVTYNLC